MHPVRINCFKATGFRILLQFLRIVFVEEVRLKTPLNVIELLFIFLYVVSFTSPMFQQVKFTLNQAKRKSKNIIPSLLY